MRRMYTANTMASAIEALGMSLPNSSGQEAVSESKLQDSLNAGQSIMRLIEKDIKPRDIMTKALLKMLLQLSLLLVDQQMQCCI